MNRSDVIAPHPDPFAFLAGGGEMGRMIRSMDWSATPLGPVESWPQSLRTTVNICLAADLPICVIWGSGLVQLYNDGYRSICGGKHPRSMGQNFPDCWKEAWPVIGEAHDKALAGDTAFLETQRIFLERHGFLEECFFTFSFSPIREEAGRVGGLFHPVIEMTAKMLGERRTRALRDLAARTSKAKTVTEALDLSAQTLAEHDLDLPFVLLYAIDASGRLARLVGRAGVARGAVASPGLVDLEADEECVWPLGEVVRLGVPVHVDDVSEWLGPVFSGPYPESPNAAFALPIIPPGAKHPTAVFVAGVSSRLPMNEAYRSFYDLLASGVTTAVANAQAYEEERQRSEALAELDRAKTAFFSNVSHEFRTPLTLMLGPVEDLLSRSATDLSPSIASQLEVVNRNGLRLLRLVNSLLDFSRIEAGRVRAQYQPTDLAAFTAELASVFRAAIDHAGLTLTVDCPPLDQPVFVDRDMWEKVVLNLLSNAFKFTFEGGITVSVRQSASHADLIVRDTGTGVPAAEMPRLFERFHRVENAKGRTHEGSGIGLALVQELLKLHGGSITAESILGTGTTFIACVPLGATHLPTDQIAQGGVAAVAGTRSMPFVEEALRWLPEAAVSPSELPSLDELLTVPDATPGQQQADERPRVLVADDNADMRQYVVRLLADQFRVEAVPDGAAALEAVRRQLPDLVLTDVMMPRLDGFELLRELRADPLTSGVPVIMLSARAGEESRVEGMQAGADDYLVKPFGARELLARVTAHLKMARIRQEASDSLRQSGERTRTILESITDGFYALDRDWRFTYVNAAGERFLDRTIPGDLLGKSLWDEYPGTVGSEFEQVYRRVATKGLGESFSAYYANFDRWYEVSAYPAPDGLSVYFRDVTERKKTEEQLRASEERRRQALDAAELGTWSVQPATRVTTTDGRFRAIFGTAEEWTDYLQVFAVIHPDDLAAVEEAVTAATRMEDPVPYAIEYRIIHPDGSLHWVYAKGRSRIEGTGPERRIVSFDGTVADITTRKEVAEVLNEADRRLRMALTAARMVAWELDPRTQKIIATDNLEDLYGLLPGTTLSVSNQGFALIHPDDVAHHRDLVIKASTDGGSYQSVFRLTRPVDGRVIWLEERGHGITNQHGQVEELVGVVADITERKEVEAALLQAEARFRTLADNMLQFTWTADATGWIYWYNQRWHEYTGTTLEEMQGWGWQSVHHPDYVEQVTERFKIAVEREEPWEDTFPLRGKDGQYRWFLSRAQPIRNADGILVQWFGTNTDVTEQRALAEQLQQAVAELSEQDRRKDEFLSILAHELRNPLAPLSNGLQLLNLMPAYNATVAETRAMMERQLAQMVRLVDDLMDVSRITRGKVELRRTSTNMAQVVQQAVETSRPLIDASGHQLTIRLPSCAITVNGDSTRLAQVISNLLNNAAKYSEPSGHITLDLELHEHEAMLRVSDTGMGISPHILPLVFDLFTQGDQSLHKAQGGLGIGLSLVKRLVELHGGRVEAHSAGVGQGSVFTVWLPVITSTAALGEPDQPLEGPAATGGGRRILVADDNVDAADTLSMLLEMMGHEVRTVHDGAQAVALAETFSPQLILLDIGMPEMNGYEACRHIREQKWGQDITLVALTGWGQKDDRRQSAEAGFDHHLVKPVDSAALQQLLVQFPVTEMQQS